MWFYEKQKVCLTQCIDEVDKESELIGLRRDIYLARKDLEEQIQKINKEDETKWLQRSKEEELLVGAAYLIFYV